MEFQCIHCKKTYSRNKVLRQHVKVVHPDVDLPPTVRVGRKPKCSRPARSVKKERPASAEFGMHKLLLAQLVAAFDC